MLIAEFVFIFFLGMLVAERQYKSSHAFDSGAVRSQAVRMDLY